MRNFLRLLKYLKKRWLLFLVGVSVMMMTTLFGGVSIVMLKPVFEKLFQKPVEAVEYDSRSIIPQIKEEFSKSIPATVDDEESYISVFVVNLGENFQNLLDRNHPLKVLGFLCISFLIIIFLKSITYFAYTLIFGILENQFSRDMRDELYKKISEHSLSFFDKFRAGDLISRMVSDIELMKTVIIANLAHFVYNFAQVVMFMTIAMVISYKLTIFALVAIPLLAIILGSIAKKLKKYSLKSQVKAAGITNELEETISSFKVILAFAKQDFQFRKFARETYNFYRARVKMVKYNMMNRPMSEFLSTALGLVLLWYGGRMILNPDSDFDAASFIVFIGAMYSAFQPLRSVFSVYADWQKGLGVAVRYFEIFDIKPEIISPPDAVQFEAFKKVMKFDHVSFAFDNKKPVLTDINLEIKRGEVIALVGPSGGGKTTLTNLIPRFYDPTGGAVLLDGVDLRKYDVESVRKKIGIVTQETLLFHDTVFNNIAFGVPDIDPELVYNAAKSANAHDFITQMSEGYRTIIGEKGSRLSGGQKQRIAIARAILNDPEIIIFDEATSALDSEAEMMIQVAMSNIIKNRTVIMVAHRLSTIRNADRILVIDKGSIIEEGSHADLMSANGSYKYVHDLQFNSDQSSGETEEELPDE